MKMKMRFNRQTFFKEFGIVIIFICLVIILSLLSPMFLAPKNLVNILKQTSINGILSLGMMFVIISGGFDLSIGSIVGVTGVLAALLGQGQVSLLVPLIVCIACGAIFGILNGVGVSLGKLPPFIMTLGMMTALRGLALVISGGQPITGISEEYVQIAGGFIFGGIPYLALYFVIAIIICAFILSKTVYGRRIYACGGNIQTAKVSGINVTGIQISVYVISGIMAGIAGFILTSRTTVGAPTAGEAYEMDAITACVIGGVSMSGGVGKWSGVVIGALLISIIANGLDIMGVSSHYQKIIKGAIIIAAVLSDTKSKSIKA
jgi:ribose/xylose/arabinose/galactoside ABC-type transport system permease subunit